MSLPLDRYIDREVDVDKDMDIREQRSRKEIGSISFLKVVKKTKVVKRPLENYFWEWRNACPFFSLTTRFYCRICFKYLAYLSAGFVGWASGNSDVVDT